MRRKNIIKIALDIFMALVFAILFNKTALGGMTFHEIAGLAVGAFIIIHMIQNRAWLKGVTKKIFNPKLPTRTKVAYIVDVLLLVAVTVIIITGILMSKVLFANLINVRLNVSGLHKAVSYIALALIGTHIGLSWNRVTAIAKKLLNIPKKRTLGAIATACAIIVFSLGSYNIVSTGYFDKVASIASDQSQRENGKHSFGSEETGGEEASAAVTAGATASNLSADAVSSASLNNNNSQSAISGSPASDNTSVSAPGGFGNGNGKTNSKGYQGSAGVLMTIYQNLSIVAAFAVFIFYIDKLIQKKPKKTEIEAAD